MDISELYSQSEIEKSFEKKVSKGGSACFLLFAFSSQYWYENDLNKGKNTKKKKNDLYDEIEREKWATLTEAALNALHGIK